MGSQRRRLRASSLQSRFAHRLLAARAFAGEIVIHRVAFCHGGTRVCAMGEGSNSLSMYCTATGATISRGRVEHTASGGTSILSLPARGPAIPETLMVANGKRLTAFEPCRE